MKRHLKTIIAVLLFTGHGAGNGLNDNPSLTFREKTGNGFNNGGHVGGREYALIQGGESGKPYEGGVS